VLRTLVDEEGNRDAPRHPRGDRRARWWWSQDAHLEYDRAELPRLLNPIAAATGGRS
jgi:hypothetical protein